MFVFYGDRDLPPEFIRACEGLVTIANNQELTPEQRERALKEIRRIALNLCRELQPNNLQREVTPLIGGTLFDDVYWVRKE
jgi:hypothetical protein